MTRRHIESSRSEWVVKLGVRFDGFTLPSGSGGWGGEGGGSTLYYASSNLGTVSFTVLMRILLRSSHDTKVKPVVPAGRK
ncbi:hypothetical protein CDAR_498731 [Caerostris darwini]|uniref:Uncharacterized protein n=1 Tax=Caerostris darwini TaxID=1538125 RepID=A0AAV4SMJ8_9ARAC|nr:hypothetical protein CDAR_498731 [Caerostris darwini]